MMNGECVVNSFRHDFVVPPPSKREVFKAEIPAREDQANSAQTRLQLVDIMTSYVNKQTEGVKSAFSSSGSGSTTSTVLPVTG